jgi:RHS repeat-associated protein
LSAIVAPGGVTTSYAYDGPLLLRETWAGPVPGSVAVTYNNDLRVATQLVNGGSPVSFGYDVDGLLTNAGALTLARRADNGLLAGTTLGSVTTARTYSAFGELASEQASAGGTPLIQRAYTRDVLGRITQMVETVQGVTTAYGYAYDAAGRLATVARDGTPAASYAYDANGNRLSVTTPSGVVAGTYDAQDRLLTYGTASYAYTAAGELLTKTVGAAVTRYTYDALGNLTVVVLPNGTQVEYIIDGRNRRIGRRVNGTLVQGFLYAGKLAPVAELDGAGAVVSRFVYGTRVNVPAYMTKSGTTYRLVADHLGSVRLVINTTTGAVAQRIDYDEFGRVIQNTNPGFQPFGFAGGLYDDATQLTRFGARDYDAQTGRWTSKDPIRFNGGDSNLYAYVHNDPTSSVDILGTAPRDKWYGFPKEFRRWYHRQDKDPIKGEPSIDREGVEEAYEEWKRRGKPDAEGHRTEDPAEDEDTDSGDAARVPCPAPNGDAPSGLSDEELIRASGEAAQRTKWALAIAIIVAALTAPLWAF